MVPYPRGTTPKMWTCLFEIAALVCTQTIDFANDTIPKPANNALAPEDWPYEGVRYPADINLNESKITLPFLVGSPITEAGGYNPGWSWSIAAAMMVKIINANDDLLPGFQMQAVFANDQCITDPFLRSYFEWISNAKSDRLFGVIGPGCHGSTDIVATLAPKIRLVHISQSTNPKFVDRAAYPNFFRSIVPDSSFPFAWRALCLDFQWNHVFVIIDDLAEGKMEEIILATMKAARIHIEGPHHVAVSEAHDMAPMIREKKLRIVIAAAWPAYIRQLMCSISKLHLKGFVHMTYGWFGAAWWSDASLKCSEKEMVLQAQSALQANAQFYHPRPETLMTCWLGHSAQDFADAWHLLVGVDRWDEGTTVADAVCMLAKVLDEFMVRRNVPPEAMEPWQASDALWQEMNAYLQNLIFEGASGTLRFHRGTGDPIGNLDITQVQGDSIVLIAVMKISQNEIVWKGSVRWHAGAQPPKDAFPVCNKGVFDFATEVCRDCPYGSTYLEVTRTCICIEGFGTASKRGIATCSPCEPGYYSKYNECEMCLPGSFAPGVGNSECALCGLGSYTSDNSGTYCSLCPPGKDTREFGASNISDCEDCPLGWYAEVGMTQCAPCPNGKYTHLVGQSSCGPCPFFTWSDGDHHECRFNAILLLFCCCWCLIVAAPIFLAWTSIMYQVPIDDLTYETYDCGTNQDKTGHYIIRLKVKHWLVRWAVQSPVPVHFSRTGNPFVDGHRNKFYVTIPAPNMGSGLVPTMSLCIVDRFGEQCRENLETSSGRLHISPLVAIGKIGPHDTVPSSVISLILFLSCFHVLLLPREGKAISHLRPLHFFIMAYFSVVVTVVLSMIYQSFLARRTRLKKLHKSWHTNNSKHNPDPKACERGAGRAVSPAQMDDLLNTFAIFIRNRNMYYVCANLVLPLTKPHELSFAEVVGPKLVVWYCSHFWGTPFVDSCACLRNHANSCEQEDLSHDGGKLDQLKPVALGRAHSKATYLKDASPTKSTYWICTMSNNQWRITEELGTSVEDTSFFVCLRSGIVRGTCMLMDRDASCLTRAWCLFEVLQTELLQRTTPGFIGLRICTPSGVLQYGNASIENAMAIAENIASLDVRNAEATVQADKDMINAEVMKMEGGFDAMNKFIKQNLYNALLKMHTSFEGAFIELQQHLRSSFESLDNSATVKAETQDAFEELRGSFDPVADSSTVNAVALEAQPNHILYEL